MSHLLLTTASFPEHPAMDTAVSHALLLAVSRGELDPVFRLHVPGRVVAFGRADRVQPGYPRAVRSARAHGYAAVERLAGGRAAVFHQKTLAFSYATPTPDPRDGITERFRMIAEVMEEAFSALGVDARIGELPGEYCPGEWSVNVAGRFKVMGVGQRLVRHAAHVGGVIVVDGGRWVRDVLVPVYRALHIDWDPRTTGALADRAPGVDNEHVASAVLAALGGRHRLRPFQVPEPVIAEAGRLVADHLPRVA